MTYTLGSKNTATHTLGSKNTATYTLDSVTLLDSFLLMESGSKLLLETGDSIILDDSVPAASTYTLTTKN